MVNIPIESIEFQIEEWLKNIPYPLKEDMSKVLGFDINSSRIDIYDKLGSIEQYIIIKEKQFERMKEEEKEKRASIEKLLFLYVMKSSIDNLTQTIGKNLEASNKISEIERKLREEIQNIKALPPYKGETSQPSSESDLVGTPFPRKCHVEGGPEGAVLTVPMRKGLYEICTVAYHAHRRTFLQLHVINASKLKEGGCPLEYSRGIIQRFIPWNRCKLGNGYLREIDLTKTGPKL